VNLLGVYREHDKAETDARLQRAGTAGAWSRTPLHERIAFLTRLAELLEERGRDLWPLITAEMAAAGGLHWRDQENAPGTPATSPKRGGLSQATARPRLTGADHL